MFSALQSGATNEYHKLRTKRVSEILKTPNMSNDDFVFLDNFVKTYFPDASKALKNVLTQDALKKVFQGTQYKELDAGETVFTPQEVGKYYILVIAGKIDVVEENNAGSALKSFAKGEVLNPADILALAQPSKELKGVTTEKSEVLMYEKELYDSVILEFASAATNSKVRGVSKHFMKIKKMDRSSKEEFLTYFKTEKFTKGTVIVNIKSKVEEIYLIQTGKVALCASNETVPSYPNKIVFGIIGPENIFNEIPLLFEKASPYYAVCLEDTEVLSLARTNLNFVTDPDSLSDLRGNSQSRQRLQSSFLELYQKKSKEEIEQAQKKICEKAGVTMKDINDAFEKFDPKSKTSHQFAKNLEKFNKTMEKPGGVSNNFNKLNVGPLQKFSEFATPRLVSKDPNFRTLDPQRQLALLALRNEGANRRAGNPIVQKSLNQMNKDDIMKMQTRLLNEEKAECDKIMQKKTISEKANLQAPVEEEKTAIDDKKGLFNKMKMANNQLLAQLGVKETAAGEEPLAANAIAHAQANVINPIEPVKTETQEVKPSEPVATVTKTTSEADERGLKMTRGNLANLLGIGANPNIKPQADIIAKKRTNLKNFL